MMNLAQFIADGILDAEYIHADGGSMPSCPPRLSKGRAGSGLQGISVSASPMDAYEMYSIISGARIPIQMSIAEQ